MSKFTKSYDEFFNSMDEKWNLEGKKKVKSTGEWKKKTVTELKAKKKAIKDKEHRTAEDTKKLRQINFAIRAKTGWGKVKEEEIILADDNVNEVWKDKLQNVYDDLEDFKSYDETYGVAKRLGFKSAEEAWEANPKIQGSTNPKDYKVIKEKYDMDLEGGDMAEEHAKAVIDRTIENSKDQEAPIDLMSAFKEVCKENDIPEDDSRADMIAQALNDLLDTMSGQVKNLI